MKNAILGGTALASINALADDISASVRKGKSRTQKFNMHGYAAPRIDDLRIGVIGLGGRGFMGISRFHLFEGAVSLVGGIHLEFEIKQNILVGGEGEKLLRRGDTFPAIVFGKFDARRERAQLFERMIAHESRAVRRTLQRVIVNEHQAPVFGKMKIRLYHIHAAFERVTEGCHRIFGDDRAFAAMSG